MMVVTSFEPFLLKETKQMMGRLFKYRFAWIEFKGRNRNWERFLGFYGVKKVSVATGKPLQTSLVTHL